MLSHLEHHDGDTAALGYAGQLSVGLASTPAERQACRCLLLGSRGMGAFAHGSRGAHYPVSALDDHDGRDYLAVWDNLRDRIVAVAALVRSSNSFQLPIFDLAAQFELRPFLKTRGGAAIELAHATVDPSYRDDGRTVRLLFKGLASFMTLGDLSMVLTSVTVSRKHGDGYVYGLLDAVRRANDGRELLPLRPWVRLPRADDVTESRCRAPSTLKYLLRMGAYVHPEPAWDAINNVATFAVVVDRERIERSQWRRLMRI